MRTSRLGDLESTSTPSTGSEWQSGISASVRFAAWMPGDLRHGEHVAFGQRLLAQRGDRFRPAMDAPLGARDPALRRLVADIDHARLPVGIEVGKVGVGITHPGESASRSRAASNRAALFLLFFFLNDHREKTEQLRKMNRNDAVGKSATVWEMLVW